MSIGTGLRLTLPARIIQLHRLAAGIDRMAAVELERLSAVVVLIALLARKHLDRRGGKLAQQLGETGAAESGIASGKVVVESGSGW